MDVCNMKIEDIDGYKFRGEYKNSFWQAFYNIARMK